MSPAGLTSVVLADDHPFVLRGILDLLRAEARFAIPAACTNGSDALAAMREHRPDVAVLDIAMPDLDGLAVLAKITEEKLSTRVVLLTATASDEAIFRAIEAGVAGLVLKQDAPDILIDCIDAVTAGRYWLPPEIIEPALAREAARRASAPSAMANLTLREREIAQLVARGLSNKQIAKLLRLSDGTVKVHLHNIYEKMDLPNRASLAVVMGAGASRL